MGEDTEWVEVRRFSDYVEAELVEQFLRDHGLRVQRRGDGTNFSGLDRFVAVLDIRLLVPSEDLDEARDALEAMTTEVHEEPFRGPAPPPERISEPPVERPRSARAAFVLALLVPIGGGHFYARSNATGVLLALGTLGGAGAAMFLRAPTPMFGAMLLVVLDALGAPFAAKRFNKGRTWSNAKQRLWAVFAVALAFGAAGAWQHVEHGSKMAPVNERWEPAGTHACGGADVASCTAQCDKGNALSCTDLAQLLLAGEPRQEALAMPALERACAVDYPPSCIYLGEVLTEGEVVTHDPKRAITLFRRACDEKLSRGCLDLGYLYRNSPELAADKDDAWRAFHRGCQLGEKAACEEQQNP